MVLVGATMDVDWCLTCERHLVRLFPFLHLLDLIVTQSGNWTYCSPECQRRAPRQRTGLAIVVLKRRERRRAHLPHYS